MQLKPFYKKYILKVNFFQEKEKKLLMKNITNGIYKCMIMNCTLPVSIS